MLDEASNYRRKSSLVPAQAAQLASQSNKTACFIHSLLEGQRTEPQAVRIVDHLGSSKDANGTELHEAVTHSRLLTKKQLSDMAWGVRELSKQLGGLRLKLHVRNVFILTKAHDESLIHNTREVAHWLLAEKREPPYTVCDTLGGCGNSPD